MPKLAEVIEAIHRNTNYGGSPDDAALVEQYLADERTQDEPATKTAKAGKGT